jgi:hypothetical protein
VASEVEVVELVGVEQELLEQMALEAEEVVLVVLAFLRQAAQAALV